MIIFDLSQVVISAVCAVQMSSKTRQEFTMDLVRKVSLAHIRNIRKQLIDFGGQIVIACDSNFYWRKSVFPYYKANRKNRPQVEGIDWNKLHEYINQLKNELDSNFPYKVIEVSGCEADDVIATLVLNRTDDKEKIVIVSSDGDFLQLQQFPNVFQWSIAKKAFVELIGHPEKLLKEKILRGDKGDGIPNVLSDSDTFVTEGKRQKTLTKQRLEMLMSTPIEEYEQDLQENYNRNKVLINLVSCIPNFYQKAVCSQFSEKRPKTGRIFDYLVKNKLTNLIDDMRGLT